MILKEWSSFGEAKVSLLEEDGSHGSKDLYLNGIFIQGGVRNHNERVYPVREIEKAVEDVNKRIAAGRSVLGECDHPDNLTINLNNVSHMITKMWMKDNYGMGKLKLLPTPIGNTIRCMIEAGVQLGVSSRGTGNVGHDGQVSDFEIVTVDIVANPSAPEAFPKPVYEAFMGKNGAILEDVARAVAHDPKAQKHLSALVMQWIKNELQ